MSGQIAGQGILESVDAKKSVVTAKTVVGNNPSAVLRRDAPIAAKKPPKVTEKVPAGFIGTFDNPESEFHRPGFTIGDVKRGDETTVYKNLVVDVGWFIGGRKDPKVSVADDVPG